MFPPFEALIPKVLLMMCAASGGVCHKGTNVIAVTVTEAQCRTALNDPGVQGVCIDPEGRVMFQKRTQ